MWVKVDDRYHQNMKTTYIGQAAADLHIAALEYCNTHLTDGFIPAADVPTLRRYKYRARVPRRFSGLVRFCQWLLRETLEDSIAALTTSYEGKRPMWQRAEVDGVPGYRLHDFHEYQPKRKNVIANKRRASERTGSTTNARTQPPASVQPAEVYVQPAPVYVQPEGVVRTTDPGVRADSHKDERARVPGTDPGTYPKDDPGTIPVLLLSDQQAGVEVCDAHTPAPARAKPAKPKLGRYAFDGRPPVPAKLHVDFLRRLGGDVSAADVKLQAWYRVVAGSVPPDQPIAENDFQFWEPRFTAWVRDAHPAARAGMRKSTESVVAALQHQVSYD